MTTGISLWGLTLNWGKAAILVTVRIAGQPIFLQSCTLFRFLRFLAPVLSYNEI